MEIHRVECLKCDTVPSISSLDQHPPKALPPMDDAGDPDVPLALTRLSVSQYGLNIL